MNNFKDFRVAFLHSKFWTHNSEGVPDTKVVLNEDFVRIQDVIKIPEQIKHIKIYWLNHLIAGDTLIPGHWNYAYVDGKFYHLVKLESRGYIKGLDEELFYYNLVYDDWQNEWITNNVYLKGTLELTGDQDLVMQHIHQMSPIIDNVNGFRFLNGVKGKSIREHITELKLPPNPTISMKLEDNAISSFEKANIETELQAFHAKGKLVPPDDHLLVPLIYRVSDVGNWKWNILQGLNRYKTTGFQVYDVTVESNVETTNAAKFRNLLENILGTTELYLASNNDNRVFSFAKSINPTKWVEEIDLSECTDITILDRLRLVPLYGVSNPIPKFSIEGFVTKILNRQGWPSDYRKEMEEAFENIVVPALGGIMVYDEDRDKKVWKDARIEKIRRDIIDWGDPRGATKNPEWLEWAETRLIRGLERKNHIWDNHKPAVAVAMSGLRVNLNNKTKEEIDEIKANYASRVRTGRMGVFHYRNWSNIGYCLSEYSNLVYLPDEYKLTCDSENCEALDFSRNPSKGIYLALIPDYDRNGYVLAGKHMFNNVDYDRYVINRGNRIGYDPKDPQAHIEKRNGETEPVEAVVFSEITYRESKNAKLDWKKADNEFYLNWLNLGKGVTAPEDGTYRDEYTNNRYEGAKLLRLGCAFLTMQHAAPYKAENYHEFRNSEIYTLRHKMWHARCPGHNFCDVNEWSSIDKTSTATIAAESVFKRPPSRYSDKKRWRRFHTEICLPVKTDTFNTLDILRKYDSINDAWLRWDVINTGISKGYIGKRMRTFWDKKGTGKPGAYTLTKEEQEKIPKNTVVQIWLCLEPLSSPDDEAKLDQDSSFVGKEIDKLMAELLNIFFKTEWESKSEPGAIPDVIRNETEEYPDRYPKIDGQSQLSLSWCKPHKGIWYTAWTRFIAPKITEAFRFDEYGYWEFDKRGTEDWIMTVIPNDYQNNTNYQPTFTFRERVGNISRNGTLAFLYNSYHSDTVRYSDLSWDVEDNTWSNKNKEEWIRTAEKYHNFFKNYLNNWNNLILSDYINHTTNFKTTRLEENPTKIPNDLVLKLPNAKGKKIEEIKFTTFDKDIAPFVVPLIDPDHIDCALKHWNKDDSITSREDRMTLYREKLNIMVRTALQFLSSWNTWLKFEGTNWYASVKLNLTGGYPKWDYELFTNERSNFKTKDEETWNFINHKESDVDAIINTRNELNIYGHKFPLKSRKITDEDILDIGLHVKPLDDIKQSEAAAWYSISMNLNEQDVFQTFIETPKELVKYQGFSAYEREKLIREIGLKGQEFLYDKQMLEYQKEENKFTNQYEKDWLHKEWKYEVARGATQIVGGVVGAVTGGVGAAVAGSAINLIAPTVESWNRTGGNIDTYGFEYEPYDLSMGQRWKSSFHKPNWNYTAYWRKGSGKPGAPPRVRGKFIRTGVPHAVENRRMAHYALQQGAAAAQGVMGIVGGALTIAEAYESFDIKDKYRQEKFAMAEKKLAAEGDMLNIQYEYERKNLLDDLWAQSANVVYPQLNANLVYKLYNKDKGINDIHMVQYFPQGKLLEYIKEYYREFGYNIMVRNFVCRGIHDIKRHLRYQFIYEINHPNLSIQEMIRARALAGIKIIPWTQ